MAGFVAASIRVATPLLLAATGETITERAGVINLGLEGSMLAGALAAALGASAGGPWLGIGLAITTGMVLGAAFAAVTVGAGVDQIISGMAFTLGAVGLTGTVYRAAYGAAGAGLTIPTLGAVRLPVLADLPLLGPSVFAQPVPTYIALLAPPAVWWMLYRTRAGLALRAAGEGAVQANAMGVPVRAIRAAATIVGGGFAGLAGATLVLTQAGTFTERMTAGRGFVAIAIVVLGRWNPLGAAVAAVLFGAASAMQFVFQTLGLVVPYQVFLMLPYLLTLLALAGFVGRARAPADLGKAL